MLLACACEPEATPLPVNLPTLPPASATAPPNATAAPLRYAVAPDALPYLTAQDRALISASAQIIPLDAAPADADLGTQYDFVVAVGDLPDGTRTDTPLRVDLVVNTSLPPLDNPKLVEILRRAVDPQKIVATLNLPYPGVQAEAAQQADSLTLRADLANAGYPDGFDLTVAAAPGADALVQLLSVIGIEARLVSEAGETTHLAFVGAQTSVPPADAIPLYSIPISYRAVDGLSVTFTPSGFPIVAK